MNKISVIVDKKVLDSNTKLEKYSEEANFQFLQNLIAEVLQKNYKKELAILSFLLQNSKLSNNNSGENYNEKDFCELDKESRVQVLKKLNKKDIKFRVVKRRGYNILKKKFFVEEYSNLDASLTFIYFYNFKDYFDYLDGSIYTNACYFGYNFSKDEIKSYNLDQQKLNFNSFEVKRLKDIAKEENATSLEEENHIDELAAKAEARLIQIKEINNMDEFCDILNSEKYNPLYPELRFAILYSKFEDKVRDFVVDQSANTPYFVISPMEIYFYYGQAAFDEVIEKYNAHSSWTNYKHKRNYRETIEYLKKYKKITYEIYKNKYFYLYVRSDIQNTYPKVSLYYCFNDFDSLVKYVVKKLNLKEEEVRSWEIKKLFNDKKEQEETQAIAKYYDYENDKFVVKNGSYYEFDMFCDFVYFLDSDLSNANLVYCDGLENIINISSINLNGACLRSFVAKKAGLEINKINIEEYSKKENGLVLKNELETRKVFELQTQNISNDNSLVNVFYISDIHLPHLFTNNKCETKDDLDYLLRTLTIPRNLYNSFLLVAGDISNNFELFKIFLKHLNKETFIVLGNHEYWPFPNKTADEIVSVYRDSLKNFENVHLLHNEIYYLKVEHNFFSNFTCSLKKITNEELQTLSVDELKEKLKMSKYIIFGGTGFAGKNNKLNANNGIYSFVIDREQEILESEKFDRLYHKVVEAAKGMNVIILTHMPKEDWSVNNSYEEGFMYVSGHNHKNCRYDDGITRIFADNQIGYNGKIMQKSFLLDYSYNYYLIFFCKMV